MKTAQEPTNSAQVIRTTTERRVLPASSLPSDQKAPEFWAYIASIPPELWERHLLYIYRVIDESTGKSLPCEKTARYMTMPDNTQVEVSNREEFEFALQKKYGGGTYRLILKKGAEWVGQERVRIEGPSKPIQFESSAPTITTMSESSAAADVAKTAMHMVSSKEAEAVNIGVNALRSAAEVMARINNEPRSSPLQDQLMNAVLAKLLNPPDPLEQLKGFAAVLQMLSGNGNGNGTGPLNPLFQKIMEIGLDRVVNPPSSAPAVSATAEIARMLPQMIGLAGEAAREWRVGSEAQRDTALIMTGKGAVVPPALPPGASAAVNPTAPNPTSLPGAPQMTGTPSLEWVEDKVIEILNDPENTPDEAADETIGFLSHVDPKLLQQLVLAKEAGVMQLFNVREHLRPALKNLPKLQEYIKAFFKYAAEWEQPAPAAGNGATTKPN